MAREFPQEVDWIDDELQNHFRWVSSCRGVTMPGPIGYQDIPRKMKRDYEFPAVDRTPRILDQMSSLLTHFQKPQIDLRELLTDAANLMAKQFSLKAVSIGLRGSDGIYRYEVMVGYRHETETASRKMAYTYEQFTDTTVYKGYTISKYTKVFLAEDNPWLESEREVFSVPSLLGTTRKSLEDYVEGDYFDVRILGKNDQILGWIEFARTITGKLPDMSSIRCIEVIGQIIAAAIVSQPEGFTRRSA